MQKTSERSERFLSHTKCSFMLSPMPWLWLRVAILLLALWGTFRLMNYLNSEEGKNSPLFWLLAPPQKPPSPTPEQLPPRVRQALESNQSPSGNEQQESFQTKDQE